MAESKYQHLLAKFKDLPGATASSGVKKLNEADVKKVVAVVKSGIGAQTAFEVRTLSDAVISQLHAAAGIAIDKSTSKHQLSMKTAQILRQSKEIEVEGFVLINQPQDSNKPSKWALLAVE